jgi:hypothetical protein
MQGQPLRNPRHGAGRGVIRSAVERCQKVKANIWDVCDNKFHPQLMLRTVWLAMRRTEQCTTPHSPHENMPLRTHTEYSIHDATSQKKRGVQDQQTGFRIAVDLLSVRH